jgi:hypothetical protein
MFTIIGAADLMACEFCPNIGPVCVSVSAVIEAIGRGEIETRVSRSRR